ncbi:hypothetical protein FUAX_15080 [Fulvitalea axinellae]|uniref:DUF4132 domain-containing protein n=1 Tax=Fulvitalea axinellae TaxID=1182444 RepID=A0AAU9CJI5_9BACT|nr:hypothetical protein FUAX_15080 [Fulvitalea axinellae]
MKNLIELYPPKSSADQKLLLDFIGWKAESGHKTALKRDRWNQLKGLYKKAEADLADRDVLAALVCMIDGADPREVKQTPESPSQATLRYMKRRARRLMKKLGEENPELYCFISKKLLESLDVGIEDRIVSQLDKGDGSYPYVGEKPEGKTEAKGHYGMYGKGVMVDLRYRFVLGYVMLGESRHARQLNNGNGSFVYDFWKFRRTEPGMPFSEAWKKYGHGLADMMKDIRMPWYGLEFIYRVYGLLGEKLDLSQVGIAHYVNCLLSPSPVLKKLAMDSMWESWGPKPKPKKGLLGNLFRSKDTETSKPEAVIMEGWAMAYPEMPLAKKRKFEVEVLPGLLVREDTITNHKDEAAAEKRFQGVVTGLTYQRYSNRSGFPISKKLRDTALKLEGWGRIANFNDKAAEDLAYFLLNAGSKISVRRVLKLLKSQQLQSLVRRWYKMIDHSDVEQRETFLDVFKQSFEKMDWEARYVMSDVLNHEDKEFRALSWRILQRNSKKLGDGYWAFNAIWSTVSDIHKKGGKEALRTLFAEAPYAKVALTDILKRSDLNQIGRLSRDLLSFFQAEDELSEALMACLDQSFDSSPTYGMGMMFLFNSDESIARFLGKHRRALRRMFEHYWYVDSFVEAWFGVLKNMNSPIWELLGDLMVEADLDESFWRALVGGLENDENTIPARYWVTLFLESKNPALKNKADHLRNELWENLSRSVGSEVRSDLLPRLGSVIFLDVISGVRPAEWLRWICAMHEEDWQYVSILAEDKTLAHHNDVDFWISALEMLADTSLEENLRTRFWARPETKSAFSAFDHPALLDVKIPEAETMLCDWIDSKYTSIISDQEKLFKISIHPLPNVRDRGWTLVLASQPEVPFMLRMAECGVPEVFRKATEWFGKLPKGDSKESHAILALCDSPKQDVRGFGMDLIGERKEALNYSDSELLPCLSEHPDAYVQEKVALAMEELAETPVFAGTFDRQVLRQKNVARKAKESVKRRLEARLDMDPTLLLELANGRDKQDAEWAVLQLTKLAVADKVDPEVFSLA